MCDKVNKKGIIHQLPSGIMKGDKTTELFSERETKRVFILHDGQTLPFSSLDKKKRAELLDKLTQDEVALNDLKGLPLDEALERFAFCVYGAADSDPDFNEKGELQQGDNFMCSNNCKCFKWKSKEIKVDGNRLTARQYEIVSLFASDMPDKEIASKLSITESTLDTHKKNLFKKFNVSSKTGLITKAITQKIIQ